MSTSASASSATHRFLRTAGVCVAALWLVAIIVTDGIQKGTTRNIITDPSKAQQTILAHQAVIVIESMASFYLAGLLVAFAAILRRTLRDTTAASAAFGGTVLAAVAIILGGAISFAELTAAHHHNTVALTTLGYLVAFGWTWEGATWGFMLLATGWAVRRANAVPGWFSIATLVLGAIVVTGVGAVLFWAVAPLWFILLGFLCSAPDVAAPDRLPALQTAEPHVGL